MGDAGPGLLIVVLIGWSLWSMVAGARRCEAHIEAWAKRHGLQVVSVQQRFNPFGPFPFFMRSRSQRVFEVVFADGQGRRRPAFVQVGGFFTGSFSEDVRVVWR